MSQQKSIVKQSSRIRECLEKRFTELDLSHVQIAEDAKKFGQHNVSSATLSRYFKNISKNSLTEESLIFLCYRWGISITLLVGNPLIKDKRISTTIPPYDEKSCLARIKDIFGVVKKSEAAVEDGN